MERRHDVWSGGKVRRGRAEGRDPASCGEVRFKESREEVSPILRRKSRDEGGKQVQGYMVTIMSFEYAD